jgi:hypothetical protein
MLLTTKIQCLSNMKGKRQKRARKMSFLVLSSQAAIPLCCTGFILVPYLASLFTIIDKRRKPSSKLEKEANE